MEEIVPEVRSGVWPHKVENAYKERDGDSRQRGTLHSLPKRPNIIRSRGRTNLAGAQSTYSWNIAEMRMDGRDAMRLYQLLWKSCTQGIENRIIAMNLLTSFISW